MVDQLTLFDEPPPEPRDCQHTNVVQDREPFSGWKPGQLQAHCGECWQWLDQDGNAPAT